MLMTFFSTGWTTGGSFGVKQNSPEVWRIKLQHHTFDLTFGFKSLDLEFELHFTYNTSSNIKSNCPRLFLPASLLTTCCPDEGSRVSSRFIPGQIARNTLEFIVFV